ncbi:hypothetical protein HFO72_31275 [Rhizobium laguerreae]|uniref:hypothetical protein n=1 Tax=Rhizobium laguerreae TaxID=1076926 RepID=UPI001C918A17|nr:hypothetical protein [Rhizobium laguerreae]MBY3095218.1 hypothetical protein [Rhizobium laguerreae]
MAFEERGDWAEMSPTMLKWRCGRAYAIHNPTEALNFLESHRLSPSEWGGLTMIKAPSAPAPKFGNGMDGFRSEEFVSRTHWG